MRIGLRLCLTLGLVVALVACSNESSTTGITAEVYRDPGPWGAGVTTLTLADREVEVWYPVDPRNTEGLEPDSYFIRDALSETLQSLVIGVDPNINPPFPGDDDPVIDVFRDVPVSGQGPFPLVLFAHGASSYRNQSTFLTTHLASWGFVVASVDYLERGLGRVFGPDPDPPIDDVDLTRMVVALLASENETPGAVLEGMVLTDQIAITGHSAGGGTSVRFGGEPEVVTFIPLSAGVSREGTTALPDKPSLWLTGRTDGIVEPERTIQAFEEASAPTRLVLIDDMGHLGPSDICAIGESGGGVIAIALEAGLPIDENLQRLGTDGCGEDDVVQDGWPIIRHFVTSQLRWAFGFDEEPVGMSQEAQAFFPEATFEYDESL
jgi:dienelactone hydrolase